MSTGTTTSPYPADVTKELQDLYFRIRPPISAERMWQRMLSDADRQRLGGDLEAAYPRLGTAGMWMELRGVSLERALIEIGCGIGFLERNTGDWLLRAVGEAHEDSETALDAAIAAGGLVLRERPREAYWQGNLIDIDWDATPALWEFLWELAVRAKGSRPLDYLDLGDAMTPQALADRKSRLTNHPQFPVSLGDLVESAGRSTYRLDVEATMIRLFRLDVHEGLSEITG